MALGPIHNASQVPLRPGPGTVPNVSDALLDWFQVLTFDLITKTIVNFDVVETTTPVTFYGVRQPFTDQELMMKPEGQRAWKWETIHAYPALQLTPDDVIQFDGVQYRVMKKSDFKEYGYVRYEIVQDYTGSGPTENTP